jgi:hypothetical protein
VISRAVGFARWTAFLRIKSKVHPRHVEGSRSSQFPVLGERAGTARGRVACAP